MNRPSPRAATTHAGADFSPSTPSPPPPSASPPTRDKGKGRAEPSPGRPLIPQGTVDSLSSLLDDALSSPLDLSSPKPLPERHAPVPLRTHPRGSSSLSVIPRVVHRAKALDKGHAGNGHAARAASLDVRASPRSSFDPGRVSPISPALTPPPVAHRGHVPLRPSLRPRLVSNLTRSTLPTASLTYAYAEDHYHPGAGWTTSPRINIPERPADQAGGEASASSSRARSVVSYDDNYAWSLVNAFPDLDPETGLPLDLERRRSDPGSRLHVQRTISELSRYSHEPAGPSLALPLFGAIPPLPPLPSMPNMLRGSRSSIDLGGRRQYSTSNKQSGDWTTWASNFWSGHKKTVDGMLAEEDQADTIEEEQAQHAIKYHTPQHPMVFCHGLMGFDYLGPDAIPALQINHWRGIREVLEANGVEVMICRVPATSSIKDRAAILEKLIGEKYPGRTINLVAHSMGGLDCRYLISQLEHEQFKVASLTTISTPHRGSPFADYVIDNVIGADRLPQLLGVMEAMQIPNSGDGNAFSNLRTKAMAQFNAEVVDDPDVKYYSWGANFEPSIFDTFRWPHSVILAKEGPNDGLVSVHSARWGEYRGTLLDVNHLDLVGWVNAVRYMLSGLTGKPIAFKPATFYLEISDYLAVQGF
ncbi:uncharacterized protein EHS24_005889 [Apiotrichum porosum]|uniref:GPI inositol-deacylase n=1 Tax=Apiotrichum porosum TaxID=105984 RepID=A0A427XZV8_9TREE|nr:uncharacterized protein EHS24_005889 [Apiotrichum porosum]RSH84369.1 hypothetical protein EHS24_005889 [Apiotrichum porosum]